MAKIESRNRREVKQVKDYRSRSSSNGNRRVPDAVGVPAPFTRERKEDGMTIVNPDYAEVVALFKLIAAANPDKSQVVILANGIEALAAQEGITLPGKVAAAAKVKA